MSDAAPNASAPLCSMPRNSTLVLSLIFVLAAIFSLTGSFFALPWMHFLFTPLATLCIFSIALSNWRSFKKTYAFWISIGLFFSLLGDVALLRPGRYFLPGLMAFLFAHIAYLMALTRQTKFPARFSLWLIYLSIAAALYAALRPGLPGELRLPVAGYAILLALMAGQAMGRWFVRRTGSAWFAAMGALLFMLSDALLASDRFRAPLPCASLLILVPYFAGQYLMALSTSEL